MIVLIADKDLNIIWSNRASAAMSDLKQKLYLFDGHELDLPLDQPVTAEYKGTFGGSCAVHIQPLDSDSSGYLIHVYTCDDIERLSDRSGHLKFKTNFLGNIRNELSQVIFMLDANRQKYVDSGDLDYLRLDSEARYRILRTFSATANLNELTKYYNGFFSTEVVCISQVLTELCDEIGDMFERQGCELKYEIIPSIHLFTNEDRFRAAVCNLLINAHMYNTAQEKVCKVSLGEQEGSIVLCVQDNGGSVKQSELERFKKPFEAFNGFGEHESLGIAIASSFCSSVGGDLIFECKQGEYTRAIMKIPIKEGDIPGEFRIARTPMIKSPYDLQYCILAKGLDPMKK